MSNLLVNRSFEDALTTGWGSPTAGVSRSGAFAFSGSYSCLHQNPTSDYSARSIESDQYPALEGWTYRLGLNIYIQDSGSGVSPSSSTTHIRARMKFFDSGGGFLQYGYWMNWYPPSHLYASFGWTDISQWDQWIYRQFDYIAPAGTAFVSVLLESREVNNPSPPPVGQPDNNVYIDLVYLGAGEASYETTDDRLVGGIGSAHSQVDQRVAGYLLGRNYDEKSRLVGTILANHSKGNYLVKGRITYRYQYLDEPSEDFLQAEDDQCSRPRKQLLIFHDSFPEQTAPGPGGRTRYVDITDRVISFSDVSRDIPTNPSTLPVIMASDFSVVVDNSDNYFTPTHPDSFLYGITDYVGWKEGVTAELWSGFLVDINLVKMILVAKMVIIRIPIDSTTGTATIAFRDSTAQMLDKVIGTDDPSARPPGPAEWPTKSFVTSSGYIKMRHANYWGIFVQVNIGEPFGIDLGKLARAKLIEEEMNKPVGSGGLVTAAEEKFTCVFDEETQLYTFGASGTDWIQFYADTPTAERFGFTLGQYYPSGPGAPPTGSTEIVSDTSLASDTVNFTDLLEALFTEASYDPGLVDIESVPSINFMNVSFENKTIIQCVSEVAQCGSGILWMDRRGYIYFRRFESLDLTTTKELSGEKNYTTAEIIDQDAEKKIRRVSVSGKFEDAFGVKDSGVQVGSEYSISNNLVETAALAQDMADKLYWRFNIKPSYINIRGEYLPSVEIARAVQAVIDGRDGEYHGQVVSSQLNVGSFTHNLQVQPIVLSHTWSTRDEWEDFVSEDATERLLCPWDDNRLQMRLMEVLAGYRIYQFEIGPGSATARANFLEHSFRAENEDGVFFSDHFDDDPIDRYEVMSMEVQRNGGPEIHPGPFALYGNSVRIHSLEDNRITFIRLLDLLDETPPTFLNYELTVRYIIEEIQRYISGVDWEDQHDQAKWHYFGMLIRIANDLHCNWALSRAGGTYSPMIGYLAGSTSILYGPSIPAECGVIGEWHTGKLKANDTALTFGVAGVSDTREVTTPVFDPWTLKGQVAAGFSRCMGRMDRFELWSNDAPSATNPVFEFRTSTDGISWTAWSTTFPVGVNTKYIQVKVTMSRATKYVTIPKLRSMTIRYSQTAS